MNQSSTNSSSWRLAMILAGLGGLLGLMALIIFISTPEESVGDVAAIEDSLIPGAPPALPPVMEKEQGPTDTVVTDEADTPAIAPNEVGRLDELSVDIVPTPVRLRIDRISVDAPVEPYGIDTDTGQMAVPQNVRDIGWYEYGPSPGQPGSAVLAAHVDLAGKGPGVFYRLRELEPGDRVSVSYDDGAVVAFVVQARVQYDKDELPLDTLFSRDGEPVLTLITCGGGFSESTRSYDSNVVVYAVPIEVPESLPEVEAA